MVVGNNSSLQITYRGGIHMSLVVTMTTVTSARFFVAMETFAMLTMMTSASHYCNDISGCGGGQYAEAFMLVYHSMYIEPKFPIWYQLLCETM